MTDRRGASKGAMAGGAVGGVGVVGLVIYLLVSVLGGGGSGSGGFDIGTALDGLSTGGSLPTEEVPPTGFDPDADLAAFVSDATTNIQDTWQAQFDASGEVYQRADVILFEGSEPSGCGGATSAIGPHYCPPDQRVYLDLGFFEDLETRFGAPGDFAVAYVIAHEIGHHVQTLLGISSAVRSEAQRNPDQANELSIRQELQADCFAGVWTAQAEDAGTLVLEPGDIDEGLTAAAAVGDDRIQEAATGRIDPESWTHGSAEQRTRWFTNGYESADPNTCDTYSIAEP